MQSKRESMFENIANVMSGLLLSAFFIQPLVFPVFNVDVGTADNLAIATVFTVVSIARGYVWRRYFNKRVVKKFAHIFEEV